MTCNEIENLLPAYREDLLSPEERKTIAGHLASCPRCGRALADLKKAEALVRGLPEVEPPPFLEQRIMSRIRQETGNKQGILRKLFYPLHLKIPIQALATLLVAVLAFYLYQGGDPETNQMAPLPVSLTDPGKKGVAVEAPKTLPAPAGAAQKKRSPAGDLPDGNRQRFVPPPFEAGEKRESAADSPAPMRQGHQRALKSEDPLVAVREGEGLPVREEASSGMRDKTEKQDSDKGLVTPPREQKRRARMSDSGAGERAKMMSTPLPPMMTAPEAMRGQPVIDLTIRVRETDEALRETEARLGRVNARIVERQDRGGSRFLKVQTAGQNVAALLELLQAIGTVYPKTSPPIGPEVDVIVSIEFITQP